MIRVETPKFINNDVNGACRLKRQPMTTAHRYKKRAMNLFWLNETSALSFSVNLIQRHNENEIINPSKLAAIKIDPALPDAINSIIGLIGIRKSPAKAGAGTFKLSVFCSSVSIEMHCSNANHEINIPHRPNSPNAIDAAITATPPIFLIFCQSS